MVYAGDESDPLSEQLIVSDIKKACVRQSKCGLDKAIAVTLRDEDHESAQPDELVCVRSVATRTGSTVTDNRYGPVHNRDTCPGHYRNPF